MDPQTLVRETKDLFGKSLTQDAILDENDYRIRKLFLLSLCLASSCGLDEDDLEMPLYRFSNKCGVSLTFGHSAVLERDVKSMLPDVKEWAKSSLGTENKQ